MRLSQDERRWVEENMGLVSTVIKNEVKNIGNLGIFTYEDIFQMGCVGLCNAARRLGDDPCKASSTYAYISIRNEIFTNLNRRSQYRYLEISADYCDPYIITDEFLLTKALIEQEKRKNAFDAYPEQELFYENLIHILNQLKTHVCASTALGIDALVLRAEGLSFKEIGQKMGGRSAKQITALVAKAQKYLRNHPGMQSIKSA